MPQATALIERDVRKLAAGEHLRLGIVLRQQGSLVGTCSLFNLDEQCRRAEIGDGIARPYWRRRFMFEAVSALIALAFGALCLNRLEAGHRSAARRFRA